MTKVLIVSDSHGLSRELEELKKRHSKDVNAMVHCGDSELPETSKAIDGFVVVKGNCDVGAGYNEELVKEIDGIRFFITHGHLYSVKSSMMSLVYRAQEVNAQVICFGHSHILGAEMVRGKLFLNPGSLRLPKGRRERTYILLEIQGSTIDLQVYDFDQGELQELRQRFLLEFN